MYIFGILTIIYAKAFTYVNVNIHTNTKLFIVIEILLYL